MYHMFDVAVAKQVGIIAAVLFQNIAFWCQHSRANGINYHDGLYWTYNSVKAFQELFPYLGRRQIENALQKLLDEGLIVKSNYNKVAYDRTTWYAVTELVDTFSTKQDNAFTQNVEMDCAEKGNGNPQMWKPIPNINTDGKGNIYISRKRADGDIPPGFIEFWEAYPRKVAKQNAVKAWAKAGAEELVDTILADIRRRVCGEWDGKDMQYIPHPATYLNQRRWEDEPPKEEVFERDLSMEEILRRDDDCSEPEGLTPCGGW